MTKASDNIFPKVIILEGTAPSSPSAGDQTLFIDSSDHKLKRKNSSGTVTTIEGASSGGVATDPIWTTSGKVAVATGSATATEQWPPGHEFDYTQVTSGNISITATTEGTANTIVTATGVAYDGSTVIKLEFFCPFGAPPAGNVNIIFVLYDDTGGGAASIGRWGQFTNSDGTNTGRIPIRLTRRLTPSSATHTYSVRAYVDSGTGTVNNGAGGSGNYMPLFISQTKV